MRDASYPWSLVPKGRSIWWKSLQKQRGQIPCPCGLQHGGYETVYLVVQPTFATHITPLAPKWAFPQILSERHVITALLTLGPSPASLPLFNHPRSEDKGSKVTAIRPASRPVITPMRLALIAHLTQGSGTTDTSGSEKDVTLADT